MVGMKIYFLKVQSMKKCTLRRTFPSIFIAKIIVILYRVNFLKFVIQNSKPDETIRGRTTSFCFQYKKIIYTSFFVTSCELKLFLHKNKH